MRRSVRTDEVDKRSTASSPERAAITRCPQLLSKLDVASRIACSSSMTTTNRAAGPAFGSLGEGS
jgi:hypothetical protein